MIAVREHIEAFIEVTSYCGDRLRLLWDTNRKRVLLCALAATPAFLVVVTTIVSAVLLIGPSGRVTNWYLQNATLAMVEKKYDKARLCYSGLLQREPDNKQYQFGLALSLFGLGDNNAAMILTRRLAPEGDDGYPPAHVFVAEQLLAPKDPTAEDLRSAEWHLLRANQADPTNRRTNALLSAIYARTNRWEQLKNHLSLAGEAVDEIGLQVARSYAQQGDTAEAEVWAKRSAAFYKNRCLADPKDKASRLKWAEASLMLREFTMAVETLESGWRDFQDPAFHQAAAHVCLIWSNQAALTPTRRISVVQRGLEFDPMNAGLLLQMTQPALVEAAINARPTTQPSEGAVVQAISRSVAASIANDGAATSRELSTALALGSQQAVVMAANMATLWGFSDDTNSRSALVFTNALAELLPDSPFAQRAHGLVLSRQGRWNRAATYLESFLKLVPSDVAVRVQLAACYDQMGMPNEAAVHRRIISATTRPSASTTQPSTQPK